ncbi:MAG: alpha/beta hydrolase [Epsilonproteobacteria bacterium (ex Lamellibrachia satsuma)]|nr:MAG: alpha/beta hydrolase [Epsilonproteobacteria bacterium (ex Lamellibrachia satsuma)]
MWYLTTIILIFTAILLLSLAMIHLGFRVPRNPEKTDPGSVGLVFKTVSIPTVSQKQLFGWLLPIPGATTIMVILHGWGGNAEQMLPLALPFHQAGMNVLLIDARNHGRSDRDGFSSLPRFAEDLEKAIEWLKHTYPEYSRKIALLGHSVGGGAVLFAASKRSDIDAVISISAFAHPKWMMQRFLKRQHIPAFLITFIIRYVEWVIGYRYEEIAPINTVCHIKCPVLLAHGKTDLTVPVEDALIIRRECQRSNIRLLTVENAGHESVEKIKTHKKELVEFLRDSGFPLPSL